MITEKDLKNISGVVKVILMANEKARNNDSFLYLRVLEYYGCIRGVDVRTMTVPTLLLHMEEYGLPKFETVRRARQKTQEKFPELAASKRTQEKRMEAEREFRAFALEGKA